MGSSPAGKSALMVDEVADSRGSGAEIDGGDPLLAAIGDRVRTLRERSDRKRPELAAAAGLSDGYLWKVESGKQNLSIRQLARIADALGVTMAELLETVPRGLGNAQARPYAWKAGSDQRRKRGHRPDEDGA